MLEHPEETRSQDLCMRGVILCAHERSQKFLRPHLLCLSTLTKLTTLKLQKNVYQAAEQFKSDILEFERSSSLGRILNRKLASLGILVYMYIYLYNIIRVYVIEKGFKMVKND